MLLFHCNIEEIQVGDKVLAYDEETGEQAYKKVVQLFRNKTEEWYHIFVNEEEIVCTGGHPFYVAELDKFIPARELISGTKLLLSTGVCAIIESIQVERLETPETTYNFEVEDFHTYYVGAGVLVHNIGCGYHSETIFEHENIGRYKDVSMHLERGGSGKVNLHIHGAGDKFIYNGTTYISNAGKVVPNVIGNSQTVATGFNKALTFANKMGWLFP